MAIRRGEYGSAYDAASSEIHCADASCTQMVSDQITAYGRGGGQNPGMGGMLMGMGGGFSAGEGGGRGQPNTVSELIVTPPKKQSNEQKIEWGKLGNCFVKSAGEHYGILAGTGASAALAAPLYKGWVPPFRVIGTPTTNLLSVLGHYVEIGVPAVTIAGRTSTNLFRIAGRLNPYLAAGLLAYDAVTISIATYSCYNGS